MRSYSVAGAALEMAWFHAGSRIHFDIAFAFGEALHGLVL